MDLTSAYLFVKNQSLTFGIFKEKSIFIRNPRIVYWLKINIFSYEFFSKKYIFIAADHLLVKNKMFSLSDI